ncbi:disintegrin and metalloproteinase domain-containing protein 9-like [Armigeres subalbatus]|uniref:disintegrin and metalloproteinase domain-containing protein 9-like n=1 Tax=Armigeres subalbatus TaxID=124917 RepID=UPI002ED398DC
MIKRAMLFQTSAFTISVVTLTAVIIVVCGSDSAESGSGNLGNLERYARIFPTFWNGQNEVIPFGESHHRLEQLSVSFLMGGENVTLDLWLNDALLPAEHFVSVQERGEDRVRKVQEHEVPMCHYHGTVRNRPEVSQVAISICDGIRGVIYDEDDTYLLDTEDNDLNEKEIYVYRRPRNESQTNRVKRALETSPTAPVDSIRSAYKSNAASNYVELVLVIDNMLHRNIRNDQQIHRYCLDLVNVMNAIYRPLNIYIALVGVVIWSDKDQIEISSDSKKTLEAFLSYRRNTLLKMIAHDNAHLLTGIHFSDSVVGKAEMGSMCTYAGSGGVEVVDTKFVALQASTIAHEMGHNFNIDHDGSDCHCPNGNCVMASRTVRTQAAPSQWSSCSVRDLETSFRHGLNSCLKNKPPKMFVKSTCGNGLLEAGEECDCGLPHVCDTKCCDAMTCRLTVNATCASGECCDLESCLPKSAGTKCRAEVGECDLAEHCDGKSPLCPRDVFLRDTEPCAGGKAYCYKGMCRTRDSQCKVLWGSTAKSIDEYCYQTNRNGTIFGNCGNNLLTGEYTKCIQEDMLCGLLHCSHRNEKLDFGIQAYSKLTTTKFSHYGPRGTVRETICNTAIVDLGLEVINPGLVPDGAKCGAGKMCWNQKCVSLSHLQENDVGEDCADGCNGHGVCNSEGNCHCEVGYGGQFCEKSGEGGSIDSGPIVDPEDSFNTFWSFFVPSILLSFAIIAGAYFYRDIITEMLRKILLKLRMRKYGHMVPPASPTATAPPKPPRVEISAPTFSTSTFNTLQFPKKIDTLPIRSAPAPPSTNPEPAQHFIKVNINNNGKITIENKVISSPFMLSSTLLDAHEAIHEIKAKGPPAILEQRSISVDSDSPLLNPITQQPAIDTPPNPGTPEPDLGMLISQVKLKKVHDFQSHRSKSDEKPARRLPQLPRQKTIGEFQSVVAEVHPKRSPATEEPPSPSPFAEVQLKKIKPRTPNLQSRTDLDEIIEEQPNAPSIAGTAAAKQRPTVAVKPFLKPSLPQKPQQDNLSKPARKLPQIPPAIVTKKPTTIGATSSGSDGSSNSSSSNVSSVAALKAKLNLEQIASAGGIKR